MRNNMCPYANMVGKKYRYFISNLYNIIENDNIEEGFLLDATNNNLDPFIYHLRKCGVVSFKKLEHSQIYSCYPHND